MIRPLLLRIQIRYYDAGFRCLPVARLKVTVVGRESGNAEKGKMMMT
jgi:hypothetical protein